MIIQEAVLSWDVTIPKKGNAKERSNYLTVAFISHTSKVMLKILQARLQQYMNHELPDVQAGFRKGRGTRDQIANIRWIIEKTREFQKNIYFCFIDYAKAFDSVDHHKLQKILREMGIPDHLTCLFSAAAAKSLQSCPNLCDPIDSSPPDSAVPGILQARTLEWVAIKCHPINSMAQTRNHPFTGVQHPSNQ